MLVDDGQTGSLIKRADLQTESVGLADQLSRRKVEFEVTKRGFELADDRFKLVAMSIAAIRRRDLDR